MERAPLHPACPRCGYDVSGVVPTWKEACPLEGTCSECGLVYEWVDVFRPERVVPPWSFEHARERLAARWAGTLVRSLSPSSFWRQIRLGARLRVGRLAWIVMPLLLAAWLVVMGAAASLGYAVWFAYSKASVGGIVFSFRGLTWLGEPWDSMLTAAVWPWRPLGWTGSVLDGVPKFGGLWGMLAPVPFLVLGQSLSRAKCKHVHLLRGWTYQWSGLLLAILLVLGVRMWNPNAIVRGMRTDWADVVSAWLMVGWMAWYWSAFTGRYLRLPRAKLVAGVMLVISAMMVLAADWMLSPTYQSMIDALGSMLG